MPARASIPYLVFAAIVAAAGAAAWLFTGHPLAALVAGGGAVAFLMLAYFFRDPERSCRKSSALVIAPADGRVMRVHSVGRSRVIEIFLAVWNVHVQRAPVSGLVVSRRHKRGAYFAAFHPLAGTRNTRCDTVFRCSRGTVGMTQVAGAIARKVECWLDPGERVNQGQRVGIIHFGSQVRLAVPGNARVLVEPGHVVRGGITPVAAWR